MGQGHFLMWGVPYMYIYGLRTNIFFPVPATAVMLEQYYTDYFSYCNEEGAASGLKFPEPCKMRKNTLLLAKRLTPGPGKQLFLEIMTKEITHIK